MATYVFGVVFFEFRLDETFPDRAYSFPELHIAFAIAFFLFVADDFVFPVDLGRGRTLVDMLPSPVDGPGPLDPVALEIFKALLELGFFDLKAAERLEPLAHVAHAFRPQHDQAMLEHIRGQIKRGAVVGTNHGKAIHRVERRGLLGGGLAAAALAAVVVFTFLELSLPTKAFGLLGRTHENVVFLNGKPERHTPNSRVRVGSKGELPNHDLVVVATIVVANRDLLDAEVLGNRECSFL